LYVLLIPGLSNFKMRMSSAFATSGFRDGTRCKNMFQIFLMQYDAIADPRVAELNVNAELTADLISNDQPKSEVRTTEG